MQIGHFTRFDRCTVSMLLPGFHCEPSLKYSLRISQPMPMALFYSGGCLIFSGSQTTLGANKVKSTRLAKVSS
eukprot:2380242-Rhodomonas_salina.1